jgi:hypothetical protein
MTLAEKQSKMKVRGAPAYHKGAKLPVWDGRARISSRTETAERVALMVALAEQVRPRTGGRYL